MPLSALTEPLSHQDVFNRVNALSVLTASPLDILQPPYSAVGDGTTNNSAAFTAARAATSHLFIPPGTFKLSTAITLPAGDTAITGCGDVSKITGPGPLFERGDVNSPLGNVYIANLRLMGEWDANQSSLDGKQLLNLAYGNRLVMENVTVESSRWFGIMAMFFDEVQIIGCRVLKCARDGLYLSGSRNISVIGGSVRHCGDDAISAHFQGGTYDLVPAETNLRIQGVYIEDSMGIKVLGARHVNISNNIIDRAKGYGVFIGADALEGQISQYDIHIEGNTIKNWIVPTLVGMVNTDDHAIMVSNYTGGTEKWPVEGSTPTITDPRSTLLVTGSGATHSPGRRLFIRNNVLVKEKPGGVTYSTWGHGQAYTMTGYSNPSIPSSYGKTDGIAIRIGGMWSDIHINDNFIGGLGGAMRCATDAVLDVVHVERNKFWRISGRAIDLAGTANHPRGVLLSRGNHYNMDPLCENTLRNANGEGGWQAADANNATPMISFWMAVSSEEDIFENCSMLAHNAGNPLRIVRPVGIGDPANAKGIPNAAYGQLITVDSNPKSATYGAVTAISDAPSTTSEIQAAINVIGSTGTGTVVLQRGATITLTTSITSYKGITLDLNGSIIVSTGLGASVPALIINNTAGLAGMTVVAKNGHFKGNAALTAGTYTASSIGVQINAAEIVFDSVAWTGYALPHAFMGSSYNVEFRSCAARYNFIGLDYDYPVAGNSGERILWSGGVLSNNVHNVRNDRGNLWFLGASLDYPTTSHVMDNVTDDSGVAGAIMRFTDCHIETTDAYSSGTLITNTGRMAIEGGAFWFDPASSTPFIENNGTLTISGYPLWRVTVDDYYAVSGTGRVISDGLTPLRNDFVPRLSAKQSGIGNSDFETGAMSGWGFSDGTNGSVVTGQARTGTYSLRVGPTGAFVGTTVFSPSFMIPPGYTAGVVTGYAKNTHTVINGFIHVLVYDWSNNLLEDIYAQINASTATYTRFKIDVNLPRGGGHAQITVVMGSHATTTQYLYVDDLYSVFR